MLNFTNNIGNDDDDDNNGGFTAFPMFQIPNEENGGDDFDPNEYLINYNEKFQNDPPILFRDAVIQQTLSCLIGKFKPNALLVGPAGVGKTKIVEDIARRIANNDPLIPNNLTGYTIWELPISNIVAGSGLVGSVEKKTKDIIKFASDPENKVILFIDEIHVLIGETATYEKIAQIMKPALARGDMKVIGATTLQESQALMKDPAFNRRFTRLIVDELSQEQTKEILKTMSVMMFEHYDKTIAINDKIIDEIVTVADEFKTMGSHRPDNAITLLDRSMANALIERKVLENNAKLENDNTTLSVLANMPTISLSKSQMKKTAMKLMTGNNEKTAIDIDLLKQELSVIKGQDDVLEYIIDSLERENLNLFPQKRTKPLTLLFAGNSGVGKTAIAKIIANVMTNLNPIILNMTEYHSPASINRIIGSPAGYVGSESRAELPFDILESNPYQIILLDEFEKSDKAVQRLFMAAFDEGYIKTSRGKIVDFSKSIIIATTNAGHAGKTDTIGFATNSNQSSEASIKDLSRFFDTELLNRFTKVLQFNPVTEDIFKDILKDTYERHVKEIKNAHSSYRFLKNTLSQDKIDELTKENYTKEFGARPIEKTVQSLIEDTILAHMKTKKAKNTAKATD